MYERAPLYFFTNAKLRFASAQITYDGPVASDTPAVDLQVVERPPPGWDGRSKNDGSVKKYLSQVGILFVIIFFRLAGLLKRVMPNRMLSKGLCHVSFLDIASGV